MTDDRHLRTDEYADAESRPEARGSLVLRIHRHLLESCPECADEWQLLADDQPTMLDLLRGAAAAPGHRAREVPRDLLSCYSEEVRQEEEDLRRIRQIRHDARMQTWHLQNTPPELREDKVDGATAQYRSRAVAEFLLERCREGVRSDPADAQSLASLVSRVLHWTPGTEGQPWVADLHALSRAWHANAIRVAGDLTAADREFARLRLDLAKEPLHAPSILAEITSLEASLRIAQRRSDRAAQLLDQAALLFRVVGDRDGEVRVLIKYGNLLMDLGHPELCLEVFERAASFLGNTRADAYYRCCTVNGRVVALCDLHRLDDAEQLLERHMDLFEDRLNSGAIVRALQARIHLGRGHFEAAEECFRDSCDAFMAAGLFSDAAMVCLDLAGTYLEAGKLGRLRRLVHEILPLLRARGVDQDVLTVVQLLARAIAAEDLSRTALADLRRKLLSRPPSLLPT